MECINGNKKIKNEVGYSKEVTINMKEQHIMKDTYNSYLTTQTE